MPFSTTIRLNTSPTDRTPSPGFQSYLPAMTRASPLNLSERVPASLVRAACGVCDAGWAWDGATLTAATIASVHATLPIRIVLIVKSSRGFVSLVLKQRQVRTPRASSPLRHGQGG